MHVIFYGPEGAGKGTQAKLLSKEFTLPILTSGDLVRDAATNDKGIIGEVCREALAEGKYVADSEMFVLWKWRLKEEDAKGDWIAAHDCAQNQDDELGAWVHAYLHRKEGDQTNAAYWYRQAKKPVSHAPLEIEWETIVMSLLWINQINHQRNH